MRLQLEGGHNIHARVGEPVHVSSDLETDGNKPRALLIEQWVGNVHALVVSLQREMPELERYENVYLGNDGDLYLGDFGGVDELRVGDLVLERATRLLALGGVATSEDDLEF